MKALTTGNTPLYIGIALLLGVGAYFVFKNDGSESAASDTPSIAALNKDLILSKGSSGSEVQKLQTLLGVPADGIFGSITENKLLEVKAVKQISLNQWATIPTLVKVKIIPIGTKVMANAPSVNIYTAYRKADGSLYTKGEIKETVGYGADLGFINSGINVNGLYVIYYDKFDYTDVKNPIYKIGMVKGSQIIKQ